MLTTTKDTKTTPALVAAESPRETLADIAKRIRRLARDRAVEVAVEIMKCVDRWEDYADETGGLEASAWVVREFRLPLSYYKMLVDASKWGGSAMRYRLTGGALVWLYKKEPTGATSEKFKEQICVAFERSRHMRLTIAQVRVIGRQLLPPPVRVAGRSAQLSQARERIRRLEAQVRALGAEPVE